MPSMRSFAGLVREDYARHGSRLSNPGFVALFSYRFGRWRDGLPAGKVRKLLRLPYLVLHRRVRNRHRIELHYTTVVGRRVRLSGRGDIVIGNRVVLGDDCSVGQGVTLGKTRDDATGWPVIGDRVAIGPGAVIAGDIRVGDDAVVGPNSVVLADVPAGARVSARGAVPEKVPENPVAPGASGTASTRVFEATTGARPLASALQRFVTRMRRISIEDAASVGPGLRLHRDGNIAIGEAATIGRDGLVGYGVTVGWRDDVEASRTPVTRLGDRVVLGSGSVVLAGVTIGDDARIGVNAVVTDDVPAGAGVVCPRAGVLRSLRATTA
jgi:serine O-acetyltransferase